MTIMAVNDLYLDKYFDMQENRAKLRFDTKGVF